MWTVSRYGAVRPTGAAWLSFRQPCQPSISNRAFIDINSTEVSQRCVLCRAAVKRKPPKPEPATESPESQLVVKDLTASPYQQTVSRSFAVGGVGLHLGEYACVRVRPAFAGDGRYFVFVPEGTNRHLADGAMSKSNIHDVNKDDPEFQAKQMHAFLQYLRAQEQGYAGAFEDYLTDTGLDELGGMAPIELSDEAEPPVPRLAEEDTLDAHVLNLDLVTPYCTVLGRGERSVASVEHLLAALEGLNVDNARIEIEGSREVPVLDGSALGWTQLIAETGLRHAETADGQLVRKMAYIPSSTISVSSGDSFITLYPAECDPKVSVGIEYDVEAIGKQWITFETFGSNESNFPFSIAPARTFLESTEKAYELKDLGYLRAGTVGCVCVAAGDSWLATADVRFLTDEPVRHSVIDLLGDLALLGMQGNAGMPRGHVVAYKPNHFLQAEFVRAVYQQIEADEMLLAPYFLSDEDKATLIQLVEEGADPEMLKAENRAEQEEFQDEGGDFDGEEQGEEFPKFDEDEEDEEQRGR